MEEDKITLDYKNAFTNKLIHGGLEECIQFQNIEMVCMSGEALLSGVARQKPQIPGCERVCQNNKQFGFVGATIEELE